MTTTMTRFGYLAAVVAMVACGGKPAPTLQQLQISPVVAEVVENLQTSVVATAVYSDGSTQDVTGQVAWGSVDGSIATAAAGGAVQAGQPGSTYLTAAFGGLQTSSRVDVVAATLVSLQVSVASTELPAGLTAQLVATGTFSDGSVRDVTSSVAWSSTREVVALKAGGALKAMAPGFTMLRAALGDQVVAMTFSVTDAAPVALALQAPDAALVAGDAAAYRVLATFTDGLTRDVTADATVTVADAGVAQLVGGARVKGLAEGATTLDAAFAGLTASAPVQVSAAALTALQVACPTGTLPMGGVTFFTASGTYSDGASGDVTTRVTWTTDDVLKAVISNWHAPGAVFPLLGGTVTVTATDALTQLSASCTVQFSW